MAEQKFEASLAPDPILKTLHLPGVVKKFME